MAAGTQSNSEDIQIVVQWLIDQLRSPTQVEWNLQDVWHAEDTLNGESDGLFEVDGHDVRENTVNVFVHTADPDAAITKIVQIFQHGELRPGMRIGVAQSKDTGRKELTYRPAYPPELDKFEIK